MPLKNLLYIGNKLSSHGFSVTTIETLGPLLEAEGFSLTYSSERKNKLFRMFEMLWVTFLKRKTANFVLIDTYSTSNFWYSFFVSQLCRVLKLKYIPILHGGNLPSRLKTNKWASGLLFKNAYKNVAVSQYLLTIFRANGFSNTVYIPNAIEIKNYDFKERIAAVPKLLWVRSFAKIYNPTMAVEVLRLVKNTFPESTLCMVGPDKDGSLNETKNLESSYDLKVNFTGRLSKNEWISLSSEFDIFINTTHFDNMPVSVLEAMALGFPVVSTNVGGLSHLLEDKKDAVLINDNDATSMANAIIELTNNGDLAKILSHNARAKALRFDWNLLKENWKEILK